MLVNINNYMKYICYFLIWGVKRNDVELKF